MRLTKSLNVMKPGTRVIVVAAITLCGGAAVSYGYTSFSIMGYPGIRWNSFGLAVAPQSGNVFISSLSYGGEDNLYEFSSAGTFVESARVPYDLGPSGNLGPIVVGPNGHLYVSAVYYDNFTLNHYILEVSQDGHTVFSSIANADAESGISYNPMSGNLLYLGYRNNTLNEITPAGVLVSEQQFGGPFLRGMTYDTANGNLYLNETYRDTTYGNIIDEYSRNGLGQFAYVKSYSMNSVPIVAGPVFAMDYDTVSDEFYVQDGNTQVVIFRLDELQVIPEPNSLAILGIGLFGLVFLRRHQR